MIGTSRHLALGICMATTACFAAGDAMYLSWKPEIGNRAEYDVQNVVTTPFGTKVTFRYSMVTTVKRVADGQVVLEVSSTEPEVTVNGPTGCPIKITGPNGDLLFTKHGHYIPTEEEYGSFSIRFGNLNSFDFPMHRVRTGDEWTREITPDPETGAKAAKATYRLLGTETIGEWDCYRIGVEYMETEGDDWEILRSSGTRWIAVADGTPILEKLTIEVPYGVQRLSIKAEAKRVK